MLTIIRERMTPGATTTDGLDSRAIVASGDDYDQAYTALEQQVPDGWIMLGVQRAD